MEHAQIYLTQKFISYVRLKGMRLIGMRPNGLRPDGMRPDGMRPNGMRPNGMRPNGMRLKGYGSRERGLKECGPTACNRTMLGAVLSRTSYEFRVLFFCDGDTPCYDDDSVWAQLDLAMSCSIIQVSPPPVDLTPSLPTFIDMTMGSQCVSDTCCTYLVWIHC